MAPTADNLIEFPRRRTLNATGVHAAVIGTVAALVLVVGWGFNVGTFQQIVPGFPTMKPITASELMILAWSCLLSLRTSLRSRIGAVLLGALAFAAPIILSIVIPLLPPAEPWTIIPSLGTRFGLSAAGLCMVLIVTAPRLSAVIAALGLLGATPPLYRIMVLVFLGGAPEAPGSPLNTMALHTSFLLVWFMATCVLMHPRLGYARAVLEPGPRGHILRRALPAMIVLPAFAAAISLVVVGAMGWPVEGLFALGVTLNVALGVALIWWIARAVNVWKNEANAQTARLSRANEALEQYASAAAHDLKAPARHVMLYGELLEEALAKGDLEAARKRAKSIRDSAAEMPVLIDGMLEFSRSGYSRLQPEACQLSALAHAGASMLEEELRAAQARIILTRDVQLWGDPALLAAVFQNLIANSVRNRRPDRAPEIRIGAERNGDLWEITIEDNGVGFDAAFAGVAFNPLARGKHQAGEGTGIGLATCRTIVQSHGGEIRVDPAFRNGARIEFTLPAKPRE